MIHWRRPNKTFRTIALAALFALALAVRLFRAHQLFAVTPDAVRFVLYAQALPLHPIQIMHSDSYHPLYPLLILALHTAMPALHSAGAGDPASLPARMSWIFAAQGIAILCGALVSLLIYRLARQFGAAFWPALAAGIMWILTKRTSAIGIDAMSDPLELCLFTASMLFAMNAMRFRHGKISRLQATQFAIAGLFAGLAYLTRPEGLAAPLIITLTLLTTALAPRLRQNPPQKSPRTHAFKLFPRRPPSLSALAISLTILFATTLIPALPYMLTIGSLTHKKPLTLTTLNPFVTNSPPTEPPSPDSLAPKQNPPTAQWIMDEVCKTFSYACLAVLLLPLLWSPRLWGRPRFRLLAIIWLLLWLLIMLWLIKTAGYLDARHTLTLQVLLFAWLALALGQWPRLIHLLFSASPAPISPQISKSLPPAFAAAAFLFISLRAIFQLNTPPWPERASFAAAIDWIRTDVADNVTISDPYTAYLSGHPFTLPGDAASPQLLARTFDRQQKIPPAIGPYRPLATFLLLPTPDTQGETYVLYALPRTLVLKNPL